MVHYLCSCNSQKAMDYTKRILEITVKIHAPECLPLRHHDGFPRIRTDLTDTERCSAARQEAFTALGCKSFPFLPYPASTHPPNPSKTHPIDADWTDYSDLLLIPLSSKGAYHFGAYNSVHSTVN